MRSVLLVLVSMYFFSSSLFAATDKYRLMWREDPSTSIVVGWCQQGGGTATVHYDTTNHDGDHAAFQFTHSVDRTASHKGLNHNFARINNLQPNTAYYFYIEDADGKSDIFWFKTAPDNAYETLSIIAGGDSRNNRTPRQKANDLVSKLRPHAVFFGGDMTDDNTDLEWFNWLDDWQLTIADDGRMTPIIAARGNHEFSNDDITDIFDTPGSDVYFALNFGGDLLRAYTLNSLIFAGGNQSDWLEDDLINNGVNTIWRTAQYHFPIRPHVSSKFDNFLQYDSWADLFADHRVQLVIECDAHTVKTTWPIVPDNGSGSEEGFIRDDINGTVYTGEGCWGAPLRDDDDAKGWTRSSGKFNQFKWILIDRYKMELRTIKVDNADDVGSINDHDIRRGPNTLDVWDNGNNDPVVIIKNRDLTAPSINVTAPLDSAMFENLNTIDITTEVVDSNGQGIQKVDFFVDGELIGTANTPPYDIEWTPAAAGEYILQARVEDNTGEYDVASRLLTVGGTTSANSTQLNTLGYQIAPNPVSDQLFISCTACNETPQQINIYDAAGQLVKNYDSFPSRDITIDFTNMQTGIYIVQIQSTVGPAYTQRIVKL